MFCEGTCLNRTLIKWKYGASSDHGSRTKTRHMPSSWQIVFDGTNSGGLLPWQSVSCTFVGSMLLGSSTFLVQWMTHDAEWVDVRLGLFVGPQRRRIQLGHVLLSSLIGVLYKDTADTEVLEMGSCRPLVLSRQATFRFVPVQHDPLERDIMVETSTRRHHGSARFICFQGSIFLYKCTSSAGFHRRSAHSWIPLL
jgi:hypothetical protein